MKTYSDEHLDFYGDLYMDNHAVLQSRSILFEMFLQAPWEILHAAAFNFPMPNLIQDDDYYPLLPEQQWVADRLEQVERIEAELREIEQEFEKIQTTGPGWPRRDAGRLKEPMAHHAHPARRGKRCAFTPADAPSTIERAMANADQCIFFKRQAG